MIISKPLLKIIIKILNKLMLRVLSINSLFLKFQSIPSISQFILNLSMGFTFRQILTLNPTFSSTLKGIILLLNKQQLIRSILFLLLFNLLHSFQVSHTLRCLLGMLHNNFLKTQQETALKLQEEVKLRMSVRPSMKTAETF